MKSKILSFSFLTVCLGIIYITMSSDVNGIYNQGSNCSSCHGNANTATTVALTGLPTTYTPGTTYNLTFTVTNPTLQKAGFNIKCSAGTFTAGTGSKTNTPSNNQITHTAPMSTTSSMSPYIETFNFTWTAPTTITAITFNCAGNAVNGDNNDSNLDQWNTINYTVQGSNPTSLSENKAENIRCYPNPTRGPIGIDGLVALEEVNLFDYSGRKIWMVSKLSSNTIDISALPQGTYILRAVDGNHKSYYQTIVKF